MKKYTIFILTASLLFLGKTAFACQTESQKDSQIASLQTSITTATVALQNEQANLSSGLQSIGSNFDSSEAQALATFYASPIGSHKPNPSDYTNNPTPTNPQYVKDLELYNGALHNATAQIEQDKADALQKETDSENAIISSDQSKVNSLQSQLSDEQNVQICVVTAPIIPPVVVAPVVVTPPVVISTPVVIQKPTPAKVIVTPTPVKAKVTAKAKVTVTPIPIQPVVTPVVVVPPIVPVVYTPPVVHLNWFQLFILKIKNIL